MRGIINTILFISVVNGFCQAQPYYSKLHYLGFGNDNLVRTFAVQNDTIYVVTGDICFTTESSCTTLSSYDVNGELIQSMNAEDFRPGNEDVLIFKGDSIIISGQPKTLPFLTSQFLRTTKSLTDYDTTQILVDDRYTYFNEGLLHHKGHYYSYGNGGIIENDSIIGYIIKWEEDLHTVNDVFIFNHFGRENMLDDLQIDLEGNLVFMNRGEKSGDWREYSKFVTIDTGGNELKNHEYQHYGFDLPSMILSQEGNYIFPDEFPTGLNRCSIKCYSNEEFMLLWETVLPFDNFSDPRSYSIIDLELASNGDVLGCGRITDTEELGIHRSGFMFRIDANTGELLWLRYYKTWNEDPPSPEFNGYFQKSSFRQIKELENGDLMIVGKLDEVTDDLSGKDYLWLLRTRSNGCLLEDECIESNFTTSVVEVDIPISGTKIYPNPFGEKFTMYLDQRTDIAIVDMQGRLVYQDRLASGTHSIDATKWQTGMYVVKMKEEDNHVMVERIVKMSP